MKIVEIVRVEKGNEATGAEKVAAFYNEMEKQGSRTSRAIITPVGNDIVYTMFADKREQKNGDLDSEEVNSNDDSDENNSDDSIDDDEDFLS